MSCPACITGSLDDGEARGVEEQLIPNVMCYVSRPEPSKANGNAIILGTDVFGPKLINARLIADTFAQHGYICVIPDYFDNDPMDMYWLELSESLPARSFFGKVVGYSQMGWTLLFGMCGWLKRHPEAHAADVVCQLSLVLREKHEIKKIGFQGYCYGGGVGVSLGSKPDAVDAVGIAHPGPIKISDVKQMTVPSLFLCAESDFTFPTRLRNRTMKALQEKQPGLAQFILYPGTAHGFAVRGNKAIPAVNAAREDALKQGLVFFNRHLCGVQAVGEVEGSVGVKLTAAAPKQSEQSN